MGEALRECEPYPQAFAILTPGQGTWFRRMGHDLLDYPEAREIFEMAQGILGYPIFERNSAVLENPSNQLLQPAIVTTTLALHAIFQNQVNECGQTGIPSYYFGHSLGEVSALGMSGVLSMADTIRLARIRGECMDMAPPGNMYVVFGREEIDEEILLEIQKSGMQIAAYNSPLQVAVSAVDRPSDELIRVLKNASCGIERIEGIGIPSHSSWMKSAQERFRGELNVFDFQPPHSPIVLCATGAPTRNPEVIKQGLLSQMTNTVRFRHAIERMGQLGVTHFLDIGPKGVLAGLVQITAPYCTTLSITHPSDAQKAVLQLAHAKYP